MFPNDMIPAPPLRRFLALGMDACICAGIYFILRLLGTESSRMFIFLVFWGWVCFALPTARRGGSPGMLATGLLVTDLEGKRPRLVRSSCRALLSVLSAGIFGMGFMLYFFTRRRQTLHDMYTNTLVLDARAMNARKEQADESSPATGTEQDTDALSTPSREETASLRQAADEPGTKDPVQQEESR